MTRTYPEYIVTPRGNIRFFGKTDVAIKFERENTCVIVTSHTNLDGVVELEVSPSGYDIVECKDGVVLVLGKA